MQLNPSKNKKAKLLRSKPWITRYYSTRAKVVSLTLLVLLVANVALPAVTSAAEPELPAASEVAPNENNNEQPTIDSHLTVKDFEMTLEVGTQSPRDGSIPLTVSVTPRFDSKTAFVRWKVPHTVELLDPEEVQLTLRAEEVSSVTQRVMPSEKGIFSVVAEVEAWRSEGNYLDSREVKIEVDEQLLVTPQTEEYKQASIIWLVARIGIFAIIVVAIILAYKFGSKKFKEWLAKD